MVDLGADAARLDLLHLPRGLARLVRSAWESEGGLTGLASVVLEPGRQQVANAVDAAAEGDFRAAAASGVKALSVGVSTGIAIGELGAAAIDAVRATGDAVGAVPKPSKGPGAVSPTDRDPKRLFSRTQVKEALEKQGGCAGCGKPVDTSAAKGHHVARHADGGKTTADNLSAVCEDCHKEIHR